MAARRDSKGSGKRPAEGRSGNESHGTAGSVGTGKGFAAEPGSGVAGSAPSGSADLSKAYGAPSLKRPASVGSASGGRGQAKRHSNSKAIPETVAQRMMRRIALATGIPSLMGMGVFVGSYLLVSRGIAEIPPGATLVASGGCFLLGLLGLSYGVLSASWEDAPGSLIGTEQIGLNISRLRQSIRSMRQAGGG